MNDYKLFALRTNQRNIEKHQDERFIRVTKDYILLMAKEMPEESVEIKGSGNLTPQDKQWAHDCIMAMLAEMIESNEEKIISEMDSRIQALEDALKEQEENISDGTENVI